MCLHTPSQVQKNGVRTMQKTSSTHSNTGHPSLASMYESGVCIWFVAPLPQLQPNHGPLKSCGRYFPKARMCQFFAWLDVVTLQIANFVRSAFLGSLTVVGHKDLSTEQTLGRGQEMSSRHSYYKPPLLLKPVRANPNFKNPKHNSYSGESYS